MPLQSAGNGALVRIVLYVLLTGPPVAYYVYRREGKRGTPGTAAALRGVGVGLLGVPGLATYLWWERRERD